MKTKKCYLHCIIRALAHNASWSGKAVPALYYSSAAQSAIGFSKTSQWQQDAGVKAKECYLHCIIRALAHNASWSGKAIPALYYSSAAQSAI